MTGWKGWAVDGTALFLAKPPGAENVGLYVQYGNDPIQVGVFFNEDGARAAEQWLDTAISVVGVANTELVKLLRGQRG